MRLRPRVRHKKHVRELRVARAHGTTTPSVCVRDTHITMDATTHVGDDAADVGACGRCITSVHLPRNGFRGRGEWEIEDGDSDSATAPTCTIPMLTLRARGVNQYAQGQCMFSFGNEWNLVRGMPRGRSAAST